MAEPIRDDELAALLGTTLGGFRALVLAVSGGVDSTALMQLVVRWLEARPGRARPRVIVATFDHGLRAGSAGEAAWVKARAEALGLEHRTLCWSGIKPKTGVQAAAREARYNALMTLALNWAPSMCPCAVVTAHHMEDQAETVLMRLARGSGVDGLSGMTASRWVRGGELAIVRPLLGVSKERLRATLEAAGETWCEDPSNESLAFERVRLRQGRKALGEFGLTPHALALVARRAARAREALDADVVVAEKRLLAINGGAFALLSRSGYARLPEEIRVRMLARVLFAFGGQATPPELAQVETLVSDLATGGGGLRTTLGGCLIEVKRRTIVIHREPAREPMPALAVRPGEAKWWDRRFLVEVSTRAKRAVRVEALSEAEAKALVARTEGLPAAAATTLPSGWNQGPGKSARNGPNTALVLVTFAYPRADWSRGTESTPIGT